MGKFDEQKRSAWEQRMARFRESGATIAKFCGSENVSVHTFHYWVGRLRAVTAKPSTRTRPAASERPMRGKPALRVGTDHDRAMIHVGWGSQAQISIPADALQALACVLDWLRENRSPGQHDHQGQRDQTPEAFQQVVVAARGKART